MYRLLSFTLVICTCWFTTAVHPAKAIDIGIWASSSYKGDVQNKLVATGRFNVVDLYNCGNSTPSVAELQQYDAVFIFSDSSFQSNTTIGDNLADYMDSGGGVVMATFAFWDSNGLGILGRIKTDGYLPFTTDGQANGSNMTLVPVEPNHELLDGVNSFNGGSSGYHNSSISTVPGATEVALWSNGQPLVAAFEPTSGVIVGLNFYPPSSDGLSGCWDPNTDGATLMANALTYAAGGADQDLDGWSQGNGDCDDLDATIYPGAPEICNDGIDQNCDGVADEGSDNDGDGITQCDGDCDDSDASRYPGAVEVCDRFDTDCDGSVDEDFDVDLDGYYDDAEAACVSTYSNGELDCDDADPAVYPDAAEACNGIDDDCDGSVDEQTDDDSDGFTICGGDCDDNDANTYPFAPEICDEVDNDCDGVVPADETWDGDGDGYVECLDCDDGSAAIHPTAQEICDGIDNNCDGLIDEGFDADGDGYSYCNDDCDDGDANTYPGAAELCDELDNDCDGFLASYEYDMDGDEFIECDECNDSDPNIYPGAVEICDDGIDSDCGLDLEETEVDNDGDGFSECGGDCDDEDANISPSGVEVCDGVDNDCNPATDEEDDADMDGFSECDDDCDDTDPTSYPGAQEACDSADNDCDGLIDEDMDYDHDGYSGCGGEDCDDYNANVNPGAVEIPYNGVDEDCDGFDDDDLDGDGFGGGTYGADCDDTDADVNPDAIEECEDGQDNDCNDLVDQYDPSCGEGDDDDSADPVNGGCPCNAAGPTHKTPTPWGLLALLALAAVRLRRRR